MVESNNSYTFPPSPSTSRGESISTDSNIFK